MIPGGKIDFFPLEMMSAPFIKKMNCLYVDFR